MLGNSPPPDKTDEKQAIHEGIVNEGNQFAPDKFNEEQLISGADLRALQIVDKETSLAPNEIDKELVHPEPIVDGANSSAPDKINEEQIISGAKLQALQIVDEETSPAPNEIEKDLAHHEPIVDKEKAPALNGIDEEQAIPGATLQILQTVEEKNPLASDKIHKEQASPEPIVDKENPTALHGIDEKQAIPGAELQVLQIVYGENPLAPDEIDEEQADPEPPSVFDQVFYNDLLMRHISSLIPDTGDRQRMQRASRCFKNYYDHHEGDLKTFSIVKIPMKNQHLLKVTYGERVRYLKVADYELDRYDLLNILKVIPKGEIKTIQKLVIKGIESETHGTCRLLNMIGMDEYFRPFVDMFVGLKHLELRRVNFRYIHFLPSCQVIQRISTLVALDLGHLHDKDILDLIGPNLKILRMSQSMFSTCSLPTLKKIPKLIKNVTMYLDDKTWLERIQKKQKRLAVFKKFFMVPWHQMFEKTINLKSGKFTPIKHCVELIYLKLIKLFRENDEENILKTISQLPFLPRLEKLTIDGYFSKAEIRKLIKVLKKCKKVVMLEIRIRKFTENMDDWIMLFENLPKRIRILKLDSVTSENALSAVANRLSNSLTKLILRMRDEQLSSESNKMIAESFNKLHFLCLRGNLNKDHWKVLNNCRIPTVVFFLRHEGERWTFSKCDGV